MDTSTQHYLADFLDWHRDTSDRTDAVLGEDARLLEWSIDVAFGVRDVVLKHDPGDEVQDSLVGLMLLGLHNHLAGMAADFGVGRYGEIRRTLRFVWELFFRAFQVDRLFVPPPDFVPTRCAVFDAKVRQLGDAERRLDWRAGILPVLEAIITDPREDIDGHFHPLWERLNALVHGSAAAIRSGFRASGRHVFNSFDEELAKELLADAQEVLSLVLTVVFRFFPEVVPSVAGVPRLLQVCPQLRAQLD